MAARARRRVSSVPTATADRVGESRPDQAVRSLGARQLGRTCGSEPRECDESGDACDRSYGGYDVVLDLVRIADRYIGI